MHADVAPRHPAQGDEGLGRAIAWAVGLHLLLAVLLIVSPLLTWDRDRLNAAGAPTMEATLDASAADQRAVERALDFTPAPLPEPVDEPAPEDTVPPPQPVPEPAPQDAPVERQLRHAVIREHDQRDGVLESPGPDAVDEHAHQRVEPAGGGAHLRRIRTVPMADDVGFFEIQRDERRPLGGRRREPSQHGGRRAAEKRRPQPVEVRSRQHNHGEPAQDAGCAKGAAQRSTTGLR